MEQGNRAHGLEDPGEGRAIHGGKAAELAQERLRPDVGKHLLRLRRSQRRRAEGGVPERLREDAAEAKQDAGAEAREAGHPGDELAAACDHLLDEDGDRLPGGLADRPEGFAEGLFRPDVQRDEPPAGFVHDLPGARLDGDGEADSVSNFYRLVFGPGDLLPGDRNAVDGEELFCLVLVKGALPGGKRDPDDFRRLRTFGRHGQVCDGFPFPDLLVAQKRRHPPRRLFRRVEDGNVLVHV